MPRVPPVTTATRAMMHSSRISDRLFCARSRRLAQGSGRSAAQHRALRPEASSVALHAHGNAHAAADAERRKALLGIALLHLVEQRDQYPRPGSADRMPEGDRAAVDVDLGGVPAEILVHRTGLSGGGLVGLHQIEIGGLPAGL